VRAFKLPVDHQQRIHLRCPGRGLGSRFLSTQPTFLAKAVGIVADWAVVVVALRPDRVGGITEESDTGVVVVVVGAVGGAGTVVVTVDVATESVTSEPGGIDVPATGRWETTEPAGRLRVGSGPAAVPVDKPTDWSA
jgi:hypothetical protein